MTKTQALKPKTPFPSAPLPWAWNYVPAGGIPTRERCQGVGNDKERERAVALIAAYREQEEISRQHDIDGMARQLDVMARTSKNAHGGVEGEMLRRQMTAADHATHLAAEAKLAELRQEAISLITPVIRRLLVGYQDSLTQAAIEAEARLEANGLPVRNGDSWALWDDSVCRALWSCRVKAEKALAALHPNDAIALTQHCLTSESGVPIINWL